MDVQLGVSRAICCRLKKDGQSWSRTSDVCWCADAAHIASSACRRHSTESARMKMRPKVGALKTGRTPMMPYRHICSPTPCHIQVRVHMWAETCSQTTHQGQQKGGGQEVDSHRVHGSGRIQEKIHKWHVCPCVCVRQSVCLLSRFHRDLLILLTAAQHIGLWNTTERGKSLLGSQ